MITMKPTDRMIRLYKQLTSQKGDVDDFIVFDETMAIGKSPLAFFHIAIWLPAQKTGVTCFHSIGMSEYFMPGADYQVELCWQIRGRVSRWKRSRCARYLADVVAYPFLNNLKLDWWEHIVDAGDIPKFSGCQSLLIDTDFTVKNQSLITPEFIKILNIYPITPSELHIVSEHDRDDFLAYIKENNIDLYENRH
jgi:Suppressor of fused protein (SUFU)